MLWFLGVIAKFLQASKSQLTLKRKPYLKSIAMDSLFIISLFLVMYLYLVMYLVMYVCRDNNFLLIFIITKIETWCNNVGKIRISIVGMWQASILHTV